MCMSHGHLLSFILRIWDLLRIQQLTQRPQCRWALWPIRFTAWCVHAATPARTSHLSSSSFEKRRASRRQHYLPLHSLTQHCLPFTWPDMQNFDPTMWFHWHACAGSHKWMNEWVSTLVDWMVVGKMCVCNVWGCEFLLESCYFCGPTHVQLVIHQSIDEMLWI